MIEKEMSGPPRTECLSRLWLDHALMPSSWRIQMVQMDLKNLGSCLGAEALNLLASETKRPCWDQCQKLQFFRLHQYQKGQEDETGW